MAYSEELIEKLAALVPPPVMSDIPAWEEYTPVYPFDSQALDAEWNAWWDRAWRPYLGDIRVEETVDDVRVFVAEPADISGWGEGGPNDVITSVITHELGHALGFGTIWGFLGLLENPSIDDPGIDTYFNGVKAQTAFLLADGGNRYRGGKFRWKTIPNTPATATGVSRPWETSS